MSKYGLLIAVCAILTAAGFGSLLVLSIAFWFQQGGNHPFVFGALAALSFFAPIGFGYFMAKDEQHPELDQDLTD